MMRQNSNPNIPTPLCNGKSFHYEVSSDDRIEVLCDSSSKGILKIAQKKDLLLRILNIRNQLIEDAKLIDVANKTNIEARLIQVIPPTKKAIRESSNESLAKIITDLFDIATLLHLHFQSNNKVSTRNATGSTKQRILNEIIKLNKDIDSQVINNVQNSESGPLLRGVQLTATQRQRQFNYNRVPNDESLQRCIFCGHKSINEPIENDSVVSKNKEKWRVYYDCLKIWDEYTNKKAEAESSQKDAPRLPKNPKTDKEMKRSPKRPSDDIQILVCMCSNAQCAQENTDIGSSCHIGCRDENNDRYPYDGYPSKKCTCPICCCRCSKAYAVSNIQRISLKLLQVGKCNEKKGSPEVATSQFLGSIITNSLISSKHILDSQSNLSARDLEGAASNAFFDCAANNIARMGSKLPSSIIRQLAEGFGTTTQVELPGGESSDTRAISKDINFHKRNNNLLNTQTSGSAVKNKQCKGMMDNLNLDYSNLSPTFKTASMQSPIARNLFTNLVSPGASSKRQRSSKSPASKLWDRLEDRVDKNLCMGKRKSELTTGEKNKRKIAKKVFKSLNENKSNHRRVANSIATSRGVPKDSLEDWVDGKMSDKDGNIFSSQDAVDFYIDGFMSSDEE